MMSALLFLGVVVGIYLFVKEDGQKEGDTVTHANIKLNSFGADRKLR